jgi:hypothetical protein
MSNSFDPQFHTRIARHGQHSVWLVAPLPRTVMPQKTVLYRAWCAEECRRLRAEGDIVLNHSQCPVPSPARPATTTACT